MAKRFVIENIKCCDDCPRVSSIRNNEKIHYFCAELMESIIDLNQFLGNCPLEDMEKEDDNGI